jgi:hypothetical protein
MTGADPMPDVPGRLHHVYSEEDVQRTPKETVGL